MGGRDSQDDWGIRLRTSCQPPAKPSLSRRRCEGGKKGYENKPGIIQWLQVFRFGVLCGASLCHYCNDGKTLDTSHISVQAQNRCRWVAKPTHHRSRLCAHLLHRHMGNASCCVRDASPARHQKSNAYDDDRRRNHQVISSLLIVIYGILITRWYILVAWLKLPVGINASTLVGLVKMLDDISRFWNCAFFVRSFFEEWEGKVVKLRGFTVYLNGTHRSVLLLLTAFCVPLRPQYYSMTYDWGGKPVIRHYLYPDIDEMKTLF